MKIKQLEESVVSKIAAGEVVVGVHSVVKELIENALDARAKKIVVELINGGKSEVKVKDDGEGMDEEDLKICFLPHTTSKISSFSDLSSLTSFGFRGEALHSISSVSKMKVISRTALAPVGHEIEVVAGRLVYSRPIHSDVGTTVIVRDLFFNVPARRKFLKSAAVESRMATEIFEKFCLSRLDVRFVLVRDQQVVYDLVASDLLGRVKVIFPDVPAQSLKPFELEYKDMQLKGCLSLNTFAKRNMVICFVNDRFVVNQTLTSAVYAAYSELLERGKHPFVVLKLSLNPGNIDVNVHPQKLEVKFVNDEDVFKFVRDSLKRLLAKPIVRQIHVQEKPHVAEPVDFYRPVLQERIERAEEKLLGKEQLRFVGTVRGRYVLFEKEEGLLILDFHAAHERILFEQIMSSLGKRNSKTLLVTMRIRMKETDAVLLASSQVLKELGFSLTADKEELLVQRIPDWMELSEVEEFLRESIDELKLVDLQGMRETIKKILADHACKKSMRTRDRVNEIEMKELAEKIINEGYSTCPHGRPLMFSIGFRDLDRFFGRD
ncbi:MAG: DNA mismatch repair protein MutL [Thermotoga sp. 50_1627]|nr:MAG: DNA mismatch repair protein MutL [Thermotoga sp. 50_64]KUK24236.1 MAG: DNA mismatch repair protein MutL [Thermotoga sp. 50_1627]MBC7122188.1 DNA mismatch repair endonuclease MutL [Pseudothermotoga sp.]